MFELVFKYVSRKKRKFFNIRRSKEICKKELKINDIVAQLSKIEEPIVIAKQAKADTESTGLSKLRNRWKSKALYGK